MKFNKPQGAAQMTTDYIFIPTGTVLFEIMRPLAIFLTILFLQSLGSVFLLTTPTCYISMNSDIEAEFVDPVLFLGNRLLEKWDEIKQMIKMFLHAD